MDTSNKPPWNPFLCSLSCGAEGYLGNLPADAHYSDGIRLLGPLGVDLKSQAQGGRAGCAVPWLCHCAPQQQLNIWLMWGGTASLSSVCISLFQSCHQTWIFAAWSTPPAPPLVSLLKIQPGLAPDSLPEPLSQFVPVCQHSPVLDITTTSHHKTRTFPFSLSEIANFFQWRGWNKSFTLPAHSYQLELVLHLSVSKSDRSIHSKESRHLISGHSKIQFPVCLTVLDFYGKLLCISLCQAVFLYPDLIKFGLAYLFNG